MEINDRLKKFIFKKLEKDLSHIEIIPYEYSIWFIDRDKKYWYLELENRGHLWWRYDFFERFFQAFSLDRIDYKLIIAEWVEDVLNNKVLTTQRTSTYQTSRVEDVLNHKVLTTMDGSDVWPGLVEEVLNHKVLTTRFGGRRCGRWVEEVLNSK